MASAQWARISTYPAARLAAALATASLFFGFSGCLGYLIAQLLARDSQLEVRHAQLLAALFLITIGFFSGHSAALGLLDAYSQGRFPLPEQGLPTPSAARPQNPWQRAVLGALGLGLACAALAYWAVPQLWPHGLRAGRFALLLAAACALLAGTQVYALTGQRFLREATLPPASRVYAGSHNSYLWLRHALPQGLVNLVLNAWAAVALLPGPFFAPNAAAPMSLVMSDALGNMTILLIAISSGTAVHAGFDVRWGIIPALQRTRPTGRRRSLVLALGLCLMLALVYAWFIVTGSSTMGAWTFVCARGLCCGVLCGSVAYLVGHWTLQQPSETSASTQVAAPDRV